MKEQLDRFKPKHGFFIGFDSDGCVFDSMELKHKECFIPNIIKYYHLQPISKYARETAEFVNLYSYWRGSNRFPALVKTFELLVDRPEVKERNVSIDDWRSIGRFIHSAPSLGNPALKAMITETNDPVLQHLLAWSEAVNRDIDKMVNGLPPFPFVRESLMKISQHVDSMVVSATPTEALHREWKEHGIHSFVSAIAGQEFGKKAEQLRLVIKDRYEPSHVLMVGDAIGDLQAARAVGAMFYPIVPGTEESSWHTFHEEIIDMFLSGSYTPVIENKFITLFEYALPKIAPWQHTN